MVAMHMMMVRKGVRNNDMHNPNPIFLLTQIPESFDEQQFKQLTQADICVLQVL